MRKTGDNHRWHLHPLLHGNPKKHMKIEEFNSGISFRVGRISYGRLCRYISTLPGVSFNRRRRFFRSIQDVGAEFTFRGEKFAINTDPWDYALWILTRDSQSHPIEMQALREHIEHEHPPLKNTLALTAYMFGVFAFHVTLAFILYRGRTLSHWRISESDLVLFGLPPLLSFWFYALGLYRSRLYTSGSTGARAFLIIVVAAAITFVSWWGEMLLLIYFYRT